MTWARVAATFHSTILISDIWHLDSFKEFHASDCFSLYRESHKYTEAHN